jgi:hypothetical protein
MGDTTVFASDRRLGELIPVSVLRYVERTRWRCWPCRS